MPNEFLMPKLGLTMEQGTILQWLVADGTPVRPGMPVMLIETDKVESEVEASESGRLHRIGAEGDTFACGQVVGLLLAEGEPAPRATRAGATAEHVADASEPAVAASAGVPVPAAGDGSRRFVSPNARRLAAERNIDLSTVRGSGPGGRVVSDDLDDMPVQSIAAAGVNAPPPVSAAPAAAWRSSTGSSLTPATTSARQLADLLGVDLQAVPPDPHDGYVTREAVARYVRGRLQQAPAATPTSATTSAPTAAPTATPIAVVAAASQTPAGVRRLSGMRGTIAKRMHASLHEMAQLTLMMDADMGAVVADRERRRSAGAGPVPAYTDYVIAAVSRAIRIHPRVNAQVTADGIAELPEIHVGLAVALDEGLVVPVVRNADRLSLDEIAAATSRLATAARAGQLTLDDLEGGTFSVSSLGMFGVDGFTPVINPPNAAILGVGRIRDDLVLVDGTVTTRKRLTLSLTWDHRVFDGAPAAAFCAAIVELLAQPSA